MSVSTPVTALKAAETIKLRTKIIEASEGQLDAKSLKQCAEIIEKGGVVIIPTDTVYGLACGAFQVEAIRRIYELKGRSYTKPLPVLLHDQDLLPLVANDIPKEAELLMSRFWPGALTLVFKTAPMALHAARGKSTIAVRIPDHGIVQQILKAVRLPMVATSANESEKESLVSGKDVRHLFSGRVDLIVDGGVCRHAQESTIVDATQYPFSVLRAGVLAKAELAQALNL